MALATFEEIKVGFYCGFSASEVEMKQIAVWIIKFEIGWKIGLAMCGR